MNRIEFESAISQLNNVQLAAVDSLIDHLLCENGKEADNK